jgi:hypothetical protein
LFKSLGPGFPKPTSSNIFNYFFSGCFFSVVCSLPFALSSFFATAPSFPSSTGAAPSAPATAGAPSAPSTTSPSTGFSGSFSTVGAATVAITKSLPIIVGVTFSGSLTKDIFILVPISKPFKSIIISSGILSAF